MGSMKQRAWVGAIAAVSLVWLLMPGLLQAAPGEWTWMSGSNTINQLGVYGTKGVEHPDNVPGAHRYSISWIDSLGNLWLFGGSGYSSTVLGSMNDLWRYDPAINQWLWMSGSNITKQKGVYGTKGVEHPDNVPGARRSSISWIDSMGRLWLFGGEGYDSSSSDIVGWLNDLWRYDPATNQWTWVSGSNTKSQVGVYGTKGVEHPANVPGGRYSSNSWIDSTGHLWLFGGYGYNSTTTFGYLNDLWRYDPETNQWTWMSGANSFQQAGVYGTKSVPDAANVPGGRYSSNSWIDSTGHPWLFGGFGRGSTTTTGYLNDLWRYDPETNQWTWVSGANTINQFGFYGTEGVPDAVNVPGGRRDSISRIDSAGNLWLFGGFGRGSATTTGYLNDLWRYDPEINQWAWVSGAETINQVGVYGTEGVPDAANAPGARQSCAAWIDGDGNLWLFGGGNATSGVLNDLWRYELQVCITDSDCDDGAFCNGAETCLNGVCGMGDSPCRTTDTCDEVNDQCIPECASDVDCDDGLFCNGQEICIGGECAGCLSPCSGLQRCNEDAGQCIDVECLINDDCPDGLVCNVSIGTCIPCVTDADCDGDSDVCFNGSCYQTGVSTCEQNADCLAGDWCQEGVCRPMNCTDDSECGAGWACSGTLCAPVGAQCVFDEDCGPYHFCFDWMCYLDDDPPQLGVGPFLAAGTWPLLPTSQENPMYLDQNYSVLWTFDDDYASCEGLHA